MRYKPLTVVGLLAVLACPGDSTEPEVYPGFSGTWTGGESSGATKSGAIKFIVTGTALAGEVAPISGSQREFIGDIADGAIAATIPAAAGGCAVTLRGTIVFANDGTGAGSASGTYRLVASPTCNTNNGTWTAIKPATD